MRTKIFISLMCLLVLSGFLGTSAIGAQKISLPIMTHWWLEEGVGQFLEEASREFEKMHPEVTVERVAIPHGQVFDQALTRLATNSPPGIILTHVGNVAQFMETGLLTPLEKYLSDDRFIEKFNENATKYGINAEGNILALPHQVISEALLVNTRLLKQAGVSAPTTMDELLEAALATTDASNRVYGIGLLTGRTRLLGKTWPFIKAYGGDFFTDGKPTLNSEGVIKGLELYKEIVDKGLSPIGLEEPILRELFAQGRIAMMTDLSFNLSVVKSLNEDLYEDVAVVPIPSPGHVGSNLVVTYWSVPKNYAHPEIAVKWLEFVLSPEMIDRYMLMTGSTHASTQPLPGGLLEDHPHLIGFAEQAPYSSPLNEGFGDLVSHYGEIEDKIIDYLQEVLLGAGSVEDVMNRAQSEIEDFVRQFEHP